MHALRPPGAGLVRGVDLTTAASTRLERLRQVLERRVRRSIETAPPLVRAGVLIPMVTRDNGINLLFTRRTDTVLTHKGQISFPGGQREDSDGETLETALRESYEEIGLEPSRVAVVGELDDVFTAVSSFVITPVVGLVEGGIDDLVLAPDEVKSLLVVPVGQLLDRRGDTTQTPRVGGQQDRIP